MVVSRSGGYSERHPTGSLHRTTGNPVLAREVDRVLAEAIYQPRVFFVHLLGFITQTAARQITLAQSIRFERFHEQACRDHGLELINVPAGTLEARVQLVDRYIRSWST